MLDHQVEPDFWNWIASVFGRTSRIYRPHRLLHIPFQQGMLEVGLKKGEWNYGLPVFLRHAAQLIEYGLGQLHQRQNRP